MTQIRALSVLPARRAELTLTTADGLRLAAALAAPVDRPPVATLVCVHPLPTMGGSMDSHLLRKADWRLPALAGLAVLRFNTRGTACASGTSEGTFDGGDAERLDLGAALAYVADSDLPAPWLLGWSFGTDVILRYGPADPAPRGLVLVSPPLRFSAETDLDAWASDGRPVTAVVPEFDDYLRPAEARRRFARIPQARVVAVPAARHLFVGHVEQAFDAVVEAVLGPAAVPLARDFDGPVEHAAPAGS